MQNNLSQKIVVVYGTQAVLNKIEELRSGGIISNDIHIFTKDSSKFANLKWNSDIKRHPTGNWVDQFKSWFSDDSAIEEGLKKLNLTDEENAHCTRILEAGGTLLVTGQDPFNDLGHSDKIIDENDAMIDEPIHHDEQMIDREDSIDRRERIVEFESMRRLY
ncbi:general stress protein [Viridibacillus arvi]|uniref:general stress protein n=1 Tax=Viridibacillus arvi TaxID=263475 RepID=UPI003D2CC4D0